MTCDRRKVTVKQDSDGGISGRNSHLIVDSVSVVNDNSWDQTGAIFSVETGKRRRGKPPQQLDPGSDICARGGVHQTCSECGLARPVVSVDYRDIRGLRNC